MMNHETELKLQAYLDGEVAPKEATRLGGWLAADAEAQALCAELRNTKTTLAGNDLELKLTESREFYWSKIARGIQRSDGSETANPGSVTVSWWLRWAAPISGLAVLVVLLTAVDKLSQPPQSNLALWGLGHEIESSSEESSANITFRSEKAGMTVVWVQNRENY